MNQLIVNNITINVVRKNIKNMHLAVYPPTGKVRLAVPLGVNNEAIRLFAVSKLGWIKRHQRNYNKQERQSPREYIDRESHYFQGRRYLLNINTHQGPPKVILCSSKYIDLLVRPNTPIEKRHEILTEWYRKELKKQIPDIITKWKKIINVQVNDWQIKQMKTKWGSCNIEKKRIWLNLELAKKPERCLEYIIVHEMVHLLERHHNDRFLALMDNYLPNWRALRKELNEMPAGHAEWGYWILLRTITLQWSTSRSIILN